MTAGAVLEAAVRYADGGLPVFPLWPIRGRRCGCPDACAQAGKHPMGKGWPNTIASVKAAESLWAPRLGERGIGLACGARAGRWVLDVDPRHGGDNELAALEDQYGRLPDTQRARTGSGGWHIHFVWPQDGPPITNSTGGLPAGLDVRGEGGFVVLPPSPHVSGERYEWLTTGMPVAPAPEWLLALIRAPRNRGAGRPGQQRMAETRGETRVPVGRRHIALVRFLGLLRSMGFSEQALVAHTRPFLEHCCEHDPETPLDLAVAESTARDVARRYPAHRNLGDE